jgi:hypothetical protein
MNYLLKHIFEGKKGVSLGVTGRRGRRLKHLLDDLKDSRGYRKLEEEEEEEEEAVDLAVRRTRFERVYGLVRQTTVCRGLQKPIT